MLKNEHCSNMNHSKMNVMVRNCSMCGEIVNKLIPKKVCQETEHSKRRKERNSYCTDCGKSLTSN